MFMWGLSLPSLGYACEHAIIMLVIYMAVKLHRLL